MSRDSISRSDYSYLNHFDMHAKPKLKNPEEVLKKHPLTTRDTIETASDKIEKDVQQRFHTNNYQLPNERMVIIARAGKFAFMAVTMPPYLILYAIPRWIASHVLPAISQTLLKSAKQVLRPVEVFMRACLRQLQRLQKIWIWHKNITVSLSKSLWNLLKQPFLLSHQLWRRTSQAWGRGRQKLQQLLHNLKTGPRRLAQNIKQKVQNNIAMALYGRLSQEQPLAAWRRKILTGLQAINNKLQAAIRWPGQALTRVQISLKAKLTPYFSPLQQRAKTLGQSLTTFGTLVLGRIQQPFIQVRRLLQNVQKKLANKIAAIRQQKLSVRTAASSLVSNFVAGWHNVRQHTLTRIRHAGAALQRLFAKIKALPQQALTQTRAKANKLHTALLNSVARLRQSLARQSSRLSTLKSNFKRSLQRARLSLTQTFTGNRESNDPQQENTPPKTLRQRLRQTYQDYRSQIVYKTKRAIYWSRLISAWMRVLSRFWMFTVRRLSHSCLDHLTWRDFKYLMHSSNNKLKYQLPKRFNKRLLNQQ